MIRKYDVAVNQETCPYQQQNQLQAVFPLP